MTKSNTSLEKRYKVLEHMNCNGQLTNVTLLEEFCELARLLKKD